MEITRKTTWITRKKKKLANELISTESFLPGGAEITEIPVRFWRWNKEQKPDNTRKSEASMGGGVAPFPPHKPTLTSLKQKIFQSLHIWNIWKYISSYTLRFLLEKKVHVK